MSGIKTKPLSKDEAERLKKLYISHREGQSLIRTDPGDWVLPAAYEKYKEDIFNMKVRPDDTFVLTWAKNGTTWVQEMVWCILNNCDLEKARKLNPMEKVFFLEGPILSDYDKEKPEELKFEKAWKFFEGMPSQRVIKSHLHLDLLPQNLLDQCKVVTCLRNPKDTLVSFYHHEKLIRSHSYDGDFEAYFELFMDGLTFFSSYWKYTVDAWMRRDHPNVCLLFFEDMKQDLEGCIKKVANFLNKDLSDDQIKALAEHLSFKKMKEVENNAKESLKSIFIENPKKDQHFFRKGEVGDWKNHLTEEMNKRMDAKIEKYFKDIELQFRYE